MDSTLTEAVLAFQRTGKGWEAIADQISLYAYNYPGKWTKWDEDKCSDFFVSFLPKIRGIVGRYRPNYQFETYLISNLRWHIKTFTQKIFNDEHHDAYTINELSDQVQETVENAYNSSNNPLFLDKKNNDEETIPFPLDKAGRIQDSSLRRRILFITLLRSADLDDHRIAKIAELTGVSPEWLIAQSRIARNLVDAKITRRKELRSRRNLCWFHYKVASNKSENYPNLDQRQQWGKKAKTWKNRFEKACINISQLVVSPTHAEVGHLLDSPPGTVSSGLHFIRKIWKQMEENGALPEYLQKKKDGVN